MIFFASSKEIENLDNLAVKNGLAILQMMELAGFQMVNLFKILKIPRSEKVVVVCGKGNNGGDGLAAARFLNNEGFNVNVILAEEELNENARDHLMLLQKMAVDIIFFDIQQEKSTKLIRSAKIIIDALLGYHLQGNPEKPYDQIIKLVNQSKAKVIAYDLPSGMDAEGRCFDPCIKADYTLTLALPKMAFTTQDGRWQSGQVYLADIGIPKFLYSKIHKNSRPNFNQSLVKL